MGDYVRFTTLQITIDPTAVNDIKLNYPYLVYSVTGGFFNVEDPNNASAILDAQSGTYVKDVVATSINQARDTLLRG